MARFFSSFLLHPIATGAIAPSSVQLAREMVDWVDWNEVATCVEFGPGTGAFTPSILKSINAGTHFFAVELNQEFAATMADKFPNVDTLNRSVAEIDEICDQRGVEKIDCIVCGLPWAQLSKIDAFSVISRTSVMEYRDTTKNLRQIAQELSVANVMEGAVQRAGDRVRINVQLIDAYSDEHLWAEIYDRELTANNLFDIQSEIAQAIAEALQATLTPSELASVADVPTDNVEAYDQYLFAKRLVQNETRNDHQTAIELFKDVLSLDPEFKLALIELARAYMTKYWQYGGDPVDRELAWETIGKAKSIDANFAELYMAEGFYWYWGHLDYERALYNIKKSIEMMPGNAEAYMWQAWIGRRGRFMGTGCTVNAAIIEVKSTHTL